MDIPPALAADLARLAEGGDPPADGLDRLVGDLARAAATAVESFLGLRTTVSADGCSVTVVLVADGTTQDQVRTSVRVPLGPAGDVVLLAGVPGALVDLAADLAGALAVPRGSVVLDADLELPDGERAHRELDDLAVVNQAVGILVARGCTVPDAHADLVRRGALAGTGPAVAARAVLASLTRGPPRAARPGQGGRGP